MPRKKKVIPEYGTCIRKGIEYYRTRIVDSDGKRVSLYARTPEKLYEKVQEAERLIAEASFRKENPTVNEYCEKWLLIQKGRLRTTTYTDYEWKVKKYIQKPLGNKYMTDVTPDDVNLAILPALSMSESVYRSTQMLYKLIFTAAEDSNVIKKSPCSKLSAKGGKPQKVKKALSDEQVEKLLTAIKDLPPYVFVMIGLYCGLRREEILALQWDCVFLDVPAPYLSVKRAWHTEHNRPVILDSRFSAYYDSIEASVKKHTVVPSFMDRSEEAAQTVELSWDGGRYTATLTDTNGVLGEYAFSSAQSDMTFAVDGNDLTISAETASADGVTITAVRNNTRQGVVVWSDGHYGPDGTMQDVVTFRDTVSDPMYAYLHLKVGYGSVKIVKTSEDGEVSGISFTVSGSGTEQTVTTNATGEMQLDDLRPGVYTVTEQSSERYEPQEVRQVTVLSGQIATVTFHNTLKRGSLEVVKTAEDGLNEGVKFHLTGTSLAGLPVDEYAVTGSNGKAVFSDVLIGTDYILSEVDTGIIYVVPEDQTTAVEWNTVTQVEVRNVLKKWSATVTKRDAETGLPQGDATLAGAVYGVYRGEELVDTYTTNESGQFTTTDYVCGNDWTIRELSPSEGYLLDDTVYPVGAEPQHYTEEYNPIALDVTEQVIRGGVALTKVDRDYPENKLEGAVFEVYRDSNRNQELDAEDELLGTMEELGGGEYALTGLCYGGYFAKEAQAPEGFYLDENAYYFAITTDGETVTVENEAGKGFVNAAQVGSLRIVKTSSDGKLEGFSFRVTGANGYDQVFQTDAEGFILVEGLRIGDYTVSEVRDGSSDGYLLPADKTASIFEGAVTEVEMHNEKKPTPEVPQTGDSSHAALWLALLGLSGIGAVSVLLMRKRKK
jgi:LPXTG-motif cell wall-anchored protein